MGFGIRGSGTGEESFSSRNTPDSSLNPNPQPPNPSLAIYIHWPFCQSKCPYCDFNSHVAQTIDHGAWRKSYASALQHYAQLLPGREVTSVFFGGGTPSLMEPATAEMILQTIAKYWPLAPDIEITLEANPGSSEANKFRDFRKAGINRLSLGVQSLQDEALQFLGRKHDTGQARKALAMAADIFPRFSFDLIYARRDQSLKDWEKELREALKLARGHMSLYQLTIEPNTQFYTLASRGTPLTAPDEEAAQMFELTQSIMRDAGMPAYEISNHAATGHESRHNLTYWRYEDYIGIGPGAHGRFKNNGARHATVDHKAPEVWLRNCAEHNHGSRADEIIDQDIAMREALIMNLRLNEGVDHKKWREKFSTPLTTFIAPEKILKLQEENFLTRDQDKLQATHAGLQRLNAVLDYLLNA